MSLLSNIVLKHIKNILFQFMLSMNLYSIHGSDWSLYLLSPLLLFRILSYIFAPFLLLNRRIDK